MIVITIATISKSASQKNIVPGAYITINFKPTTMTPKTIIISALKSKLEGTGIERVIFTFWIVTNKYDLLVRNSTGETMRIDISDNEINTIKKIFINKVVKQYNKKYSPPATGVIIQFNVESETLELFIHDEKNEIFKFDF